MCVQILTFQNPDSVLLLLQGAAGGGVTCAPAIHDVPSIPERVLRSYKSHTWCHDLTLGGGLRAFNVHDSHLKKKFNIEGGAEFWMFWNFEIKKWPAAVLNGLFKQ